MALPTASDNPFPSLLLTETAAASIGTPAAGKRRLFVDTDNVLKWKEEGGAVQPIAGVNKWDATAAPTANEDSGDGYAVGSRWIDVTNDKEYVCLDASVGAAVWTETTGAGGGGGSVATDAIWDAKGDLAVGTGADTAARLAVGTNGHVLTADSGETTGVKWAAGGGAGSDWDATIIATADQTVTNNGTLQDHAPATGPALVFAVDASSVYLIDFAIFYSGNDTAGDYAWRFAIPSVLGFRAYGWYNALPAAGGVAITPVNGHTSNGATTVWPMNTVASFTDTLHTIYAFHGRLTLTTDGAGNVQFQFANAAAGSGRESTTRAGSMLRYRKLG